MLSYILRALAPDPPGGAVYHKWCVAFPPSLLGFGCSVGRGLMFSLVSRVTQSNSSNTGGPDISQGRPPLRLCQHLQRHLCQHLRLHLCQHLRLHLCLHLRLLLCLHVRLRLCQHLRLLLCLHVRLLLCLHLRLHPRLHPRLHLRLLPRNLRQNLRRHPTRAQKVGLLNWRRFVVELGDTAIGVGISHTGMKC